MATLSSRSRGGTKTRSLCGHAGCGPTCQLARHSPAGPHVFHVARGAARMWSTIVAAIVFGGLTLAIIGSTALAQSRPTGPTSLDLLELRMRTLTQKIDRIESQLNEIQNPSQVIPQE